MRLKVFWHSYIPQIWSMQYFTQYLNSAVHKLFRIYFLRKLFAIRFQNKHSKFGADMLIYPECNVVLFFCVSRLAPCKQKLRAASIKLPLIFFFQTLMQTSGFEKTLRYLLGYQNLFSFVFFWGGGVGGQGLLCFWALKYLLEAYFVFKGKRKKKHGSDSSSSGGEISDLVQKLADKVSSRLVEFHFVKFNVLQFKKGRQKSIFCTFLDCTLTVNMRQLQTADGLWLAQITLQLACLQLQMVVMVT